LAKFLHSAGVDRVYSMSEIIVDALWGQLHNEQIDLPALVHHYKSNNPYRSLGYFDWHHLSDRD
jgi:hypothetical protein